MNNIQNNTFDLSDNTLSTQYDSSNNTNLFNYKSELSGGRGIGSLIKGIKGIKRKMKIGNTDDDADTESKGMVATISKGVSMLLLPITFPWEHLPVRIFIMCMVIAFILKYSLDIAQADKKKIAPICPSVSIIKKLLIFLVVMYYVLGIFAIIGENVTSIHAIVVCKGFTWLAALGSIITIIVVYYKT
jgi:hypothetical protein